MFKTRPSNSIALSGTAPLGRVSMNPDRLYKPGEIVTLYPERKDPLSALESLAADVLEDHGETLRVRAKHDFFSAPDVRSFKRGDAFEIPRSAVFRVEFPA
jgi:hypothetical protein